MAWPITSETFLEHLIIVGLSCVTDDLIALKDCYHLHSYFLKNGRTQEDATLDHRYPTIPIFIAVNCLNSFVISSVLLSLHKGSSARFLCIRMSIHPNVRLSK